MTVERHDGNPPSEFSDWFRKQPELDSLLGFRNYNIDYVWGIGCKFILLEEKRKMGHLAQDQILYFSKLDRAAQDFKEYYGFWIIRFENTNPEDGKIYLSKLDPKMLNPKYNPLEKEITKEQLINFLKLEWAV